MTYLGHVVSNRGIEPTADKTRAPSPTGKKSLKTCLGLINYYGRFLKHIATVLAPLHMLLREGQQWKWGKDQEEAFSKAKEQVASPPCLAHFDVTLKTTLACDANPYGVGCVLSQTGSDGVRRPVAFYARSLNETEKRYSQTDREALSIVVGVKKSHYYLYGRPFIIETEHEPLLGLFGEDKPIPVLASLRIIR